MLILACVFSVALVSHWILVCRVLWQHAHFRHSLIILDHCLCASELTPAGFFSTSLFVLLLSSRDTSLRSIVHSRSLLYLTHSLRVCVCVSRTATTMGFCLSKCLLDGDMTRELEEELDDANTRSYARQTDSGGGTAGNGGGGGAPFATTSLLAVRP